MHGEMNMSETSQAEIQPCHGASVPDVVAIGEEQESLAKWKERCGIKTENQIRLVKLAHMRYQHPDLDAITVFLQDFGMKVVKRTDEEVWYRGYGTDQYVYYARKGAEKEFLGGTFEVESYQDLQRAANLPTGSAIQELKDAPGGGVMVTVKDPEGFPINLIYGPSPAAPGEYPSNLWSTTSQTSLASVTSSASFPALQPSTSWVTSACASKNSMKWSPFIQQPSTLCRATSSMLRKTGRRRMLLSSRTSIAAQTMSTTTVSS